MDADTLSLQGFYVRDLEEIKILKAHCRSVYIDVVKGAGPIAARLKTLSKPAAPKVALKRREADAPGVEVAPLKVRPEVYGAPQVAASQELGNARSLHREVYQAVASVMTEIDSEHHKFPLGEAKRTAGAMVDSVLRSPDAFTWLSRVRAEDEYTYSHAVRSAVWGILFGRHIGLSKADLDVLAIGILLKDIGKTRIPIAILEKAQRTATEQAAFEKFVDYGVDILRKTPDIKPRATSVIKTHRERLNGSGFPQHLRGDEIPLLGKIAGIVTYYDETTHPRGHRPLSPSRAVARLYELRNVEFQADLVVEFIRAIGLYPTGTLVELNTGEIAVVVEQNFNRRLKPKVMVLTDAYKRNLSKPQLLDMAADEQEKNAQVDARKLAPGQADFIEIVQDLEPDACDFDVSGILDEYMATTGRRGLFGLLQKLRGSDQGLPDR